MIEVHLYGRFRELVPRSHADEDTVLRCEYVPGKTFEGLVRRLGLGTKDIGDCFVNDSLAKLSVIMKDADRVGLFPLNMRLIDGGSISRVTGVSSTTSKPIGTRAFPSRRALLGQNDSTYGTADSKPN